MSQENVELVRQIYAAWNQGDLDAMLAVLHPEVEFVTSGAFPGRIPSTPVTMASRGSGGIS